MPRRIYEIILCVCVCVCVCGVCCVCVVFVCVCVCVCVCVAYQSILIHLISLLDRLKSANRWMDGVLEDIRYY